MNEQIQNPKRIRFTPEITLGNLLQLLGVAMFLFGLASIFYPPLQVIIGSVTTSVAILVGGIALMVLPSLIVGNELLILGCVGAAVGVWFFAHRHGQLRGLVDAAKDDIKKVEGNL